MLKLTIAVIAVALGSFVKAADFPEPGHHLYDELQPGFFRCGHYQCLNQSDVTCEHHRCKCGGENVPGEPRNECAIPDEHCSCVIKGDPHIFDMFGNKYTLPFPCAHVIVDMTTPPTANECSVVVVGLAHFTHNTINPQVSFESHIDLIIVTGTNIYKARIVKGSQPIFINDQYKRGEPDMTVIETVENGTVIIEVPECEIEMRFWAKKGLFSLTTAVGTIDSKGLCGECEEEHAGTFHRKLTDFEFLELFVDSMFYESPFNDSDINIYPECTDAAHLFARACDVGRRHYAINFCGPLIVDHDTRHCIVGTGSAIGAVTTFSKCYDSICTGIKPCSTYAAFYGSCDISIVQPLLNDVNFCQTVNFP